MRRFIYAIFALGATHSAVDAKRSVLHLHGEEASNAGIREWLERPESELSLRRSTPAATWEGALIDSNGDGNLYENILVTSGKLPKKVRAEEMIEFVKRGGNLLWVISGDQIDSKTINLAAEFGRIVDAHPAKIYDFTAENPKEVGVHLMEDASSRVLGNLVAGRHEGRSHRLIPENPLVFPIMTARREAIGVCAADVPMEKCTPLYGTDNVLASALQTRVNSRVTIVTSDTILGSEMGKELLSWTFQEKGLVTMEVSHRSLEGRADGRGYRINDRIEVVACLKEKRGAGKQYTSLQPEDLQMEFTMLDAWIRADFGVKTEDGCVSTGPVKLPDRYGTFTLKVGYQRRGFPHLHHKETVILRPFYHDESTRYIWSALPYYASWCSMMISSTLLLYPLIHHCAK